ncbi:MULTISPECIES: hypothetical protein [unclassified Nocardioides]|uniref:hypothetical protein n=1 Tax=unclassified Nocardioides TaxID=2615069 RepID=UPI0000570D50|nr:MULTISPECIES: hypothetical protein [unclassified Nocardioides]ABL83170.1 hypothetical protein Noca_3670 [Nocardioides sp. JS614]
MRTLLAAVALLLAAPLLAACGDEGDTTATDPGSSDPGSSRPARMPTEIPAARGTVHTSGLVTVMDKGSPELCLGAVAESWPPQCGGPPIEGWDWADHHGVFERQQQVRWGQFVVTGTWDGSTFGYQDAVPAALYDAMPIEEVPLPAPAVEHTQAELEDIAGEVGDLPGAQGAYADAGQVLVDVVYDDGSLQAWADATYGTDVVIVRPALIDS